MFTAMLPAPLFAMGTTCSSGYVFEEISATQVTGFNHLPETSSHTCFVSDGNLGSAGGLMRSGSARAALRSQSGLHRPRGLILPSLPDISEVKLHELNQRYRLLGISESDIEESFIRGSGKGGQKVNKTSSCVQLVHKPTGTVIRCQQTRSRNQNRYLARIQLLNIIEREQSIQRLAEAREQHINYVAERVRVSHERKKRAIRTGGNTPYQRPQGKKW